MSNLLALPRGRQARAPGVHTHVYLAAPKAEYTTPRYAHLAARVRTLFPDATVTEARTAFRNVEDWFARWPGVLASLSAVVFVTAPGGWIGRGVWTELQDARPTIPVYLLDAKGALVPVDRLAFTAPDPNNWVRHVRVTVRRGRRYGR